MAIIFLCILGVLCLSYLCEVRGRASCRAHAADLGLPAEAEAECLSLSPLEFLGKFAPLTLAATGLPLAFAEPLAGAGLLLAAGALFGLFHRS